MAITHRRTKHTRANGTVYYTYPNSASRKYYESKYGKSGSSSSSSKKKSSSSSSGGSRGGSSYKPKPKPSTPAKPTPSKDRPTGGKPSQGGSTGANTNPTSGKNPRSSTYNRVFFNLDNDLNLPQGSQHAFAQPSSISSLINGLLRQSHNSAPDYWSTWALGQDKPYYISPRTSSTWGADVVPGGVNIRIGEDGVVRYLNTEFAQEQSMGAFGTNMVMEQYGQEEVTAGTHAGWWQTSEGGKVAFRDPAEAHEWNKLDKAGMGAAFKKAEAAYAAKARLRGTTDAEKNAAYNQSLMESYSEFFNKRRPAGTMEMFYNPATGLTDFRSTTPSSGGGGTNTPPTAPTRPPAPDGYGTGGGVVPSDINPSGGGMGAGGIYNPWGRGEGAEYNSYGPSPAYMGQSTMEALALANAYFAPQRMELAYELGDMEIDMRRLSANLGRQGDDPILQAKLFKEGMRAVRTLDVQQNTFAFQMAEQRRREEMQNFQYYDQLAQEEYRLRLQNRQYYDDLELRRRYYNLQNWQAANPPTSGSAAPAAATAQEDYDPSMLQPSSNILGAYRGSTLATVNPYSSSFGAGNITQQRFYGDE